MPQKKKEEPKKEEEEDPADEMMKRILESNLESRPSEVQREAVKEQKEEKKGNYVHIPGIHGPPLDPFDALQQQMFNRAGTISQNPTFDPRLVALASNRGTNKKAHRGSILQSLDDPMFSVFDELMNMKYEEEK